MIIVGKEQIMVPKPTSPGVSYTLWRLRLQKLGVEDEDQISGIISKVASYAEAPKEVILLTFNDWDELYAAAAKGLFAKTLGESSSSSMVVETPVVVIQTPVVVVPQRTNVTHVVMALIDHPIVVYKDAPVRSEDVAIAISQDKEVLLATKLLASAQWGERSQAQDFFDDVVPGDSKRCIFIDDYQPNTDGQRDKIRTALSTIAVTGTLFIIGHCNGEAGQMAGLSGADLAGVCNAALAGARSVVLWGCHTAGAAGSTLEATSLTGASVASSFHGALSVSKQVQGFTCFVNCGLQGARLRFTDSGGYKAATWSVVDHRFTSGLGGACKHLAAS
jgi:hypothetical protein